MFKTNVSLSHVGVSVVSFLLGTAVGSISMLYLKREKEHMQVPSPGGECEENTLDN